MIKRHISNICFDKLFGRQMRFIAGPRQIGKTTLAKSFLESKNIKNLYFNWDTREIKDKYKEDAYFFETELYDSKDGKKKTWICFDEIHKVKKWKNILKDYYDKFENDTQFIVTGSARLDWFRKSGDSLAGRYFIFKLLPLTLSEVENTTIILIDEETTAEEFIQRRIDKVKYSQEALEQLLNYGGFPEPFVKSNKRFHRRWQRDLLDRLIREDIRDLTRLIEVEYVADILYILPDKVGSPLSFNSIKNNINISYTAVRNAVKSMELTYIIFFIPPYTKKISRSLKKEKKCYLYDWTRCTDLAKKFENYIACELNYLINLWTEAGISDFKLFYIRTKDGKETDFLITKNDKPWCLFEAKLKSKTIEKHQYKHSGLLGNIPIIQIVHENKVLKKRDDAFTISASRFFV